MRKYIHRFGLISTVLGLAFIGSSTVFALPVQANIHAQSTNNSAGSSLDTSAQANASTHLATGQLKACQNRENAINNIMVRIDTRAQNQITLFTTIATQVENFYTNKGKTLSNYDQLVAAVNAAESQANSDFGTLKTSSSFSCTASNPRGIVTAFQSYLKMEITDLQNYRTAVKNLIIGVASSNGVTLSSSNQTSSGGQ